MSIFNSIGKLILEQSVNSENPFLVKVAIALDKILLSRMYEYRWSKVKDNLLKIRKNSGTYSQLTILYLKPVPELCPNLTLCASCEAW